MDVTRGVPPRVLVVWCPDWPVVVVGGAGPEVPAVVVAANLVVACSAAARAAGVRRGHRLRDAQRHCPVLIAAARDIDAEARAFEPVVATVEEFCPRVEVVRPGMCAIGARGPARYFGGERALAQKITQAVAGRGVTCRTGVADGMFAAQLAARTGGEGIVVPPGGARRFLAPHPAGLLEHAELANLLAQLGIHTLGDFAALPAQDVLARFGAVGAIAHRLAGGLEPRPLAPRPPSADLSAEMEFDPPALQAEPVVFAGKSLAAGCSKTWRDAGCRAPGSRWRSVSPAAGPTRDCGGTMGCFLRWRWRSGCAGNLTDGARREGIHRNPAMGGVWAAGRPPMIRITRSRTG